MSSHVTFRQQLTFEKDWESFYVSIKPSSKHITEASILTEYIKTCVDYVSNTKSNNAVWNVDAFGSSSWGTNIYPDSDIDLSISINSNISVKYQKQILMNLSQIISKFDKDGVLLVKPLCDAQYPIIKVSSIEIKSVKYDISIADNLCLKRNKFMIEYINYYLQECNIPIKKLIIFIKYWSKRRGINDSYPGYLSSFAFALLVLKFIQCYLTKNNYKNYNNSLIYLVEEFFKFYVFKYNNQIHSIDMNNNINDLGVKRNNRCVMEIIDPVNHKNNVAIRLGYYRFDCIMFEFKRAVEIFSTHNHGTFSILTKVFGDNAPISTPQIQIPIKKESDDNIKSQLPNSNNTNTNDKPQKLIEQKDDDFEFETMILNLKNDAAECREICDNIQNLYACKKATITGACKQQKVDYSNGSTLPSTVLRHLQTNCE